MSTVRGRPNPTRYRNAPCFCGSKKKFKHCCLNNPRIVVGEKKEDPVA